MISKRFIWKTPFSGVGSTIELGLDTNHVCYPKDTPGEIVFSADSLGGPPAGKRLGWLPLFYGAAEPPFLFPVCVLHEAVSPVFHTSVAKPKGTCHLKGLQRKGPCGLCPLMPPASTMVDGHLSAPFPFQDSSASYWKGWSEY